MDQQPALVTFRVCPTHGMIPKNIEQGSNCPFCKSETTEKKVLVRVRAERIVVAVVAVAAMLVCFANAPQKADGGLIVPWEQGANAWSWAGLALGFIVFGYVALPLLGQVPLYKEYVDAESVSNVNEFSRFKWSRLWGELAFSVVILIVVVVGWFAYVTIASGGQAWK
jgi:hypothetical protein